MKNLRFAQEQATKILEEIAIQENGLQVLQKMSLEAMIRADLAEHNASPGNMSNGYRPRRTFGRGKILELGLPEARTGTGTGTRTGTGTGTGTGSSTPCC